MKRMKKWATLLLALLLCFCAVLTGCDSSPFQQGDEFQFQSLTYKENGTEYTIGIGDTYEGTLLKKDSIVIIANADNTLSFFQRTNDNATFVELFSCSKKNDTEYNLWSANSYIKRRYGVFTYSNDTLVIHFNEKGVTMTLIKNTSTKK